MSQLGKIFLWIAAVGALVAIIAGAGVLQERAQDAAVLKQTQADALAQRQKAVKIQAQDDADKALQVQTQAALDEQKKKVDDLNTQLTAATAQQTTLQQAVKDAQDATTKAQAELTRISGVLNGSAPEEVMAKVDKLTKQVALDNADRKIFQDQLQAAAKQVADLKDALNRQKTGTMPPGISGKVTFVNTTWNFVVLNVGLSNGVVPNGELVVYRGREFLGKVKVTSAEDNTCVADIIPGSKEDIQVGDDVLN
jgi:hypothetical protein